ncbi:UDP-N-acetylglucosamine:LPS N-acetylglucosamine transferase [Desulfosporosinus acidiphilus SJ4]|uniref:UDP-N-acetylglucosamine:LPS N-acetylglucosamine transferase n=1 Tax=Desulfosporosinus acidiphilus (strain DSM 22704 / JCM 16185 / SJ4) TaxID=646529 RepID=I4D7F0_DESAJ|nr:UDP-N-acetylglucosamine--LPS N-acetylglucosamine transferase [Desulfosporosinus acidiphilus]AFM41724.1 UDP-N-acetylglucosamine:LPS N-acetylglucosamine transferase [Desulfosporosinus acidiphilus SJ4]
MKPIRLLIFSATFGAGHVKAAEALIESIKSFQPSVEIIHEDSVGKFNKYLNYFLCKLYITMMKRAPKLWGMFYKQTQEIAEDSLFQRFLNSFGRSQLAAYIEMVKPDVIVCTFPTVTGVLSQLRMKGELNVPVTAVVTDYTIHSQWIHRGVDGYIVGCPKVSEGFIARGIEPNRIRISGIPVMRKFERSLDRKDVLRNLGLDEDRLTFLVMCGACGVLEKAKWICKLILKVEAPVQAIVVCGNDHKLYQSLDNIVKEARNPVVRFKFIDNVDELMSASNIIITKAGGLIVSEALTKRLPLLIFKPIPGQEENNARFVSDIGAGRVAYTKKQLTDILNDLIANPEKIQHMSQAATQSFNGDSAEKGVEFILEMAANSSSYESISKMNASFTYSKQVRERAWRNSLLRISRPLLPVIKRSFSFFFRY